MALNKIILLLLLLFFASMSLPLETHSARRPITPPSPRPNGHVGYRPREPPQPPPPPPPPVYSDWCAPPPY
ncbi:hypothetical protein Syun_013843 [Stephania yunnanensis]|uniref:Uncharacterized protein n=1 Tax=Stephania yunnanensis TaxID=152371 RepID=A0AAP0P831_9MAGN